MTSEPSWKEAERVAGHRVDHRFTYAVVDGAVLMDVRYSTACSGCTETREYGGDGERGCGCHECGYRGRRRLVSRMPLEAGQA